MTRTNSNFFRGGSVLWKLLLAASIFLWRLCVKHSLAGEGFLEKHPSASAMGETYTRPLRYSAETSATLRLNFKPREVQQTFTAEDAEDFAKARRGTTAKRVSSRYLPVADALGCFA